MPSMSYKTFKIYTLLLSLTLTLSVAITAFMQYAPIRDNAEDDSVAVTQDVNSNDQPKAKESKLFEPSLWGPIRDHLQLTAQEENNPAVQKQIRWIVDHPVYLREAVSQAAPYMDYVYTQVVKKNLPTELVLLPIIESGYDPTATNSSSGAAGMWQLMSGTASDYGVARNKNFDGRRDLVNSTDAALDYLGHLKDLFNGDWLLAIAAYNTGPGNVKDAMHQNEKNGAGTHFWSLSLPEETTAYVPRLLALAAIVKHPEKYGVTLPEMSAKPYVKVVDIGKKGMSLSHAAKLADMRLSDLKELNPGVRNNYASLTQDKLVLPANKVAEYNKELAA